MASDIVYSIVIVLGAWFAVKCVLGGLFIAHQHRRAMKTPGLYTERLNAATLNDPIAESLFSTVDDE